MKPRNFTLTIPAAFAAAGAAHGAIIYTEVDVNIIGGGSHAIDITGDGIDSFSLSWEVDVYYGGYSGHLNFQSLDGGDTQAAVKPGGDTLISFHPFLWDIGPSYGFAANPNGAAYSWSAKGGFDQQPYYGFRTIIDDETHYGWLHIERDHANVEMHIIGFAYESTPNTPITVGAIPAPGTLALLALGAAAGSRRKRIAA